MADQKRIDYLAKKVAGIKVQVHNPKYNHGLTNSNTNPIMLPSDVETKYRKKFERQAGYRGNGVYEWNGVFSTDTRELFLMGVLVAEGVKFKQE